MAKSKQQFTDATTQQQSNVYEIGALETVQNSIVLCESDKLNIEEQLDVFYKLVMNRLLPAFSGLEKEADNIEKEMLIKSNANFNQNTMDEACVVENAYFKGINHYSLQYQMKQSFINVSTLWLYHLFEQQLNNISLKTIEKFDYTKHNSKDQINEFLIEKGLYDKVNCKKINELRLVANTIKHAEGGSKKNLKEERPDLFTRGLGLNEKVTIPLFENEICVSELEFSKYHNAIVGFWADYFIKIPVVISSI